MGRPTVTIRGRLMHGAGALRESEGARRAPEQGYAMAALLVGLSIMGLMMTVAMPVWKQWAQREKEDELIFRGQQYVHAVGLFQRKSGPGTLPPTIDVLVEQRFLRKKYKDPITNDDFEPLHAGQAIPGTQQTPTGQSSQSSRDTASAIGQSPLGGVDRRSIVTGRTSGASSIAGRGGASGGIMGVASKSKGQSIRLYNARSHYNEWAFIYVPQAQAPAAGPVPVGGQPLQGGAGVSGTGRRGGSRGFGGAPRRPGG